jgi:hypothetical protein
MNSVYTAVDLNTAARRAVRDVAGRKARFLCWELHLGQAHPCLLVFYRDVAGKPQSLSVAI